MTKETIKRVTALALLVIPGCSRTVPRDHTSLSIDAGKDPGPPPTRLSMVWMHHSTGDNILKGGLLAAIKADNVDFHDINYKEAAVDGYVIGDHTDPPDFPKAFNTPKYFNVIKSWEIDRSSPKRQHDIVMFKSCFPNSDIKTDAQLEAYKGYYTSMLPTFKAHPEILFIGMSTPPLNKKETTPENAARARRWAKWVSSEYAKDLPNVKIFDIFDALAIREGKADANYLVPQFGTDKWDSHPSPAGAQAFTRLFIPWFNRAVRAAGFDKPRPAKPSASAAPASAPAAATTTATAK